MLQPITSQVGAVRSCCWVQDCSSTSAGPDIPIRAIQMPHLVARNNFGRDLEVTAERLARWRLSVVTPAAAGMDEQGLSLCPG